jgi:manganese/zinc/iron transport system substrate-binding protein
MKRTVIWLGLGLVLGCGGMVEQGDLSARPIRVVTTTGMIADAAENVGRGRADVQALMGPGTDPHLYKATAGDVRTLEGADAIFFNGLKLEGRMADIFDAMGSKKMTAPVAEAIEPAVLHTVAEGKHDPHVWFDVQLWKKVVDRVRAAFIELDPKHADIYEKNAREYLSKLDELDAWIIEQINTIPADQRVLVTAHDAFGYFGKRYGMEVMGIQGVSTATEASAADIQRLSKLLSERRIKAIFVESSVPQSTIEALQKAVMARGWNIKIGGQLFSDAMGAAGTEEGTYVGMVRHNVRTIVEALR